MCVFICVNMSECIFIKPRYRPSRHPPCAEDAPNGPIYFGYPYTDMRCVTKYFRVSESVCMRVCVRVCCARMRKAVWMKHTLEERDVRVKVGIYRHVSIG